MTATPERISVSSLLELTGVDREARAYAFLHAAYRRTEIGSNPVRDALDCLIPFIAPYLNNQTGKQVTSPGIQASLKETFGFDIPLYAIEQLMPSLERAGHVSYNKKIRAYFGTKSEVDFEVLRGEIEVDLDDLTEGLEQYAVDMRFGREPTSSTWADALIRFLKVKKEPGQPKIANIKGTLIDREKVETALVGKYIQSLYYRNPMYFEKVLRVFMGILIEEFISTVSEIGGERLEQPVVVFYDTAVLLRLLGCSGRLYKTATEELTRYLQDLGFEISYFSGNEAEAANIIDTIVSLKDAGRELEGETADAIARGEVSITDLRALQNTFPERLGRFNIFPASDLEANAIQGARYQIDELGFREHLKAEALARRHRYGQINRENDAGYLATVVRLRKGRNTSDLAGCQYLFATTNRFLAYTSRRYLIREKLLSPKHFPPIISVGQLATIVWLMKDHKLEPERVGRELLSYCYAAFRPDHEWFGYFRQGVESVVGGLDEYVKSPAQAMTLQAARRIAQEESFGETSIVRELNMAEILARAASEHERELEARRAQLEAEKMERDRVLQNYRRQAEFEYEEALRAAAEDKELAVRLAGAEAARTAKEEAEYGNSRRAEQKANGVLRGIAIVAFVAFLASLFWSLYSQHRDVTGLLYWFATFVLAVVNVISVMQLFHLRFVEKRIERIRDRVARLFL